MLVPQLVSAQDAKINLLLYGLQGVGKTTFAASAQDHPKMSPVLFINLEGGLLSVAGRGDIHSVNISSISELEELYWAIRKGEEPFNQFKTFIIDSGSEMQQLSLQETVIRNTAEGQKKGKFQNRTLDEIYLEDYGQSTAQMKRLFRWFRDLPHNVIITALPQFVYPRGGEDGDPIEVRPAFTEKLANSIIGYVDFVWYMYALDDGSRHMLTQTKGIYRAKTRGANFAPALGETVDNPVLPDIYDLLLASETATSVTQEDPLAAFTVQNNDEEEFEVEIVAPEAAKEEEELEEVPFK